MCMCSEAKRALMQKTLENNWGYSSAGRAPALQAGGHRFDPVYLHQVNGDAAKLESGG
jgi:hypothetical protein